MVSQQLIITRKENNRKIALEKAKIKVSNPIIVINNATGEEERFKSITEAQNKLNITHIGEIIKGTRTNKNYTFRKEEKI